jgi:tetratricopeptide (TPR) repeat protein
MQSKIDTFPGLVYHSIPLPRNRYFIGRDSILQDLQQKLFLRQECERLAIVGLGGVGKTQVALQFAFWVLKTHPGYSVFWLSALSNTSFDRDYLNIGEKASLRMNSDEEESKRLVKQHLESDDAGKWLLIVDNIDDQTLMATMNNYLPRSEHGAILFTTRSMDIAIFSARKHILKLVEMRSDEATQFLKSSLIVKELAEDETVVARLLQELTYLPLAIVQAAAYLNRNSHLTIRDYLNLLRGTEKDVVDLMSREFPDDTRYEDSRNGVATTWIVSFSQIQQTDPAAAQLLSFLSCVEPKAIPQSLLPQLESKEKQAFSIGTLVSFAFLSRRGDSDVYDMHSLVHLATKVWIEKEIRMKETIVGALQHLEAVFSADNHANQEAWKSHLTHAIRLLERSKAHCVDERFPFSARVGSRLYKIRQFKEAIKCLEDVCEWKRKMFREEDPSRLGSEYKLARAYLDDRRIKEAIRIFKHVVKVRQKTLREEDHSRLASEHALASAYLIDERIKEAIEIFEHVVKGRQKTLGEEDHSRLASEHELASAYLADKKVTEAIEILEHVVKVRQKMLGEEHYSRLTSEQMLASAHLNDQRVKEAIVGFEHVVKVRRTTLRDEDHSRIVSEHELARAYLSDGRIKKAIELFEHVVEVQKNTLQKEDPDRLTSALGLASAYLSDGRMKEAIEILEHVVKVRQRMLEEEHYSRLVSEYTLAKAYLDFQRVKEATGIFEHVVAIQQKILPEEDDFRLDSEHELARAYLYDGRITDAIDLLEHVVEIKKVLLTKDNPYRLISQDLLNKAYRQVGNLVMEY